MAKGFRNLEDMEDLKEFQQNWGFWDGLKVGSGFCVGYFLMRWFIALAIIFFAMYCICTYCLAEPEKMDRAVTKVENKLGIDLVDTSKKLMNLKSTCRIRKEPNLKAKVVGIQKAGIVKYSQEDGIWRKIEKGWIGCR